MSETILMTALAKVIIAVAWADGQVTQAEINNLKNLLGRLPEVTARQWAELDMYIEAPVDEAERARLVADLRQMISSDADKALVVSAMKDLISADGAVTEDEKAVVAEIDAAIESVETGVFGGLARFVKDLGQTSPDPDAPNREAYFDDFIKNKVYYNVRRRLDLGVADLDIPEEKLRKLSLAGGIMARIALANPQITDTEFQHIVDTLQTEWHITQEEATLVTEVAVSEPAVNLDRYHLTTEFMKVCPPDELSPFLDTLFAIAAADGEASSTEIEEIRYIAMALGIPHKQFIKAKLNVPREQREQ